MPWFDSSMYHRREQNYKNDEPGAKRLRGNLADLVLTNQLPVDRVASLASDCTAAGASGVDKPFKAKTKSNVKRDVLRRLLKGCQWPSPYYADVRVWKFKEQQIVTIKLPIMLPHEIAHVLAEHNDLEQLLSTSGMSSKTLEHLQTMKTRHGIPQALAYSFWLDGVPCNWDRSESLACLTMSLPGLTAANRLLRIPLAVLPSRYLVKEVSFDEIFEAISWSCQCLCAGFSQKVAMVAATSARKIFGERAEQSKTYWKLASLY